MAVMIKTVNLTKRYGTLIALANLNLEIQEGDCFGFIGPNGAGKTTLLRMLSTVLAPDSGTQRLNAVLARSVRDRDSAVSLRAIESLQEIVGRANLFAGEAGVLQRDPGPPGDLHGDLQVVLLQRARARIVAEHEHADLLGARALEDPSATGILPAHAGGAEGLEHGLLDGGDEQVHGDVALTLQQSEGAHIDVHVRPSSPDGPGDGAAHRRG